METYSINDETSGGGGRAEGEGTTNGGMTTEQMDGLQPLPDDGEQDSADRATDRIESNTLGGTSDTGAGPAVGDGQPAD